METIRVMDIEVENREQARKEKREGDNKGAKAVT
jgi:hypothetical protein